MEKKRVLLVSQPSLLGDSLEHILSQLEDVQLTGAWPLDDQVLAHCAEQLPDLVLIADDEPCDQQASGVMSGLLEAHPNLPSGDGRTDRFTSRRTRQAAARQNLTDFRIYFVAGCDFGPPLFGGVTGAGPSLFGGVPFAGLTLKLSVLASML